MESAQWGRYFLIAGVVCVIIGIGFYLLPRFPFLQRLGRLPGDLFWRRDNLTVYFPLVTSLVISLVLSLVFILFSCFRR